MVGIKLVLTNKILDSSGAPVAAGTVHLAADFLAMGSQSTPQPSQSMFRIKVNQLGSPRQISSANGKSDRVRLMPSQFNGVDFFCSVPDADSYYNNLATILDASSVLNQQAGGSLAVLDLQGNLSSPAATIDYAIQFLAQFPGNVRLFGFSFNLTSNPPTNPPRSLSFQLTSTDAGGVIELFANLIYGNR